MISSLVLLASLAAGDAAAIRVDGVSLPAAVVTARAAELRAAGVTFTQAELTRNLVEEALLAIDAGRSGLAATPEVRANVAAERTRVLAAALLEGEISKEMKPPEEMLRNLYHSNSDLIRLDLVVLATEPEAQAVRKRLEQGGDLALEAARSLDPVSSKKRGDTGELARAQFPGPVADQLFKAAPGDLIGPLQWGPGWGVARVTSRTIGDEAGFAAKRAALESHARGKLTSQAKQHFLGVLRSREKIVVDEKFLDSLGVRIDPAGSEGNHVLATIRGAPLRYADVVSAIRKVARGGASAHSSGPAIKKQVVSKVVDDWVLAALARERGLEKNEDVAARLQLAEQRALAFAAIEQILSKLPPTSTPQSRQKAVDERLATLRAKAKVSVDDAKVTAAVKATP